MRTNFISARGDANLIIIFFGLTLRYRKKMLRYTIDKCAPKNIKMVETIAMAHCIRKIIFRCPIVKWKNGHFRYSKI